MGLWRRRKQRQRRGGGGRSSGSGAAAVAGVPLPVAAAAAAPGSGGPPTTAERPHLSVLFGAAASVEAFVWAAGAPPLAVSRGGGGGGGAPLTPALLNNGLAARCVARPAALPAAATTATASLLSQWCATGGRGCPLAAATTGQRRAEWALILAAAAALTALGAGILTALRRELSSLPGQEAPAGLANSSGGARRWRRRRPA